MGRSPLPAGTLRRLTYLVDLVALAALYVVAGRIGLALAAVAGFAALVWPPTGIALAALLVLGSRLWPGVFIGAAVVNMMAGAPPLVAIGMGAGNTLEAVVAAYALRHIPGFRRTLDRLPDVLGLIVLAALISTTISATLGVASLELGGIIGPAGMSKTWRVWWLGDAIGDLLVAPVLLVWTARPLPRPPPRHWLEAAALGLCVVATSVLIVHGAPSTVASLREAYMFFPLLIWAVLRFGQRGGVAATFVISLVAVWGTVRGHGPFVRPDLYQSLLSLQIFMGVTALTFLVLGASVSERRRAIDALEAAIAEQKRLHQTAAEANRVKSEFVAVMSHELRTPLNAIAGYADLLTMEQDPLTARQRDYLSRIRRNEDHLLSLIDGVLSFARIEAGQLSVVLQDIRVDDMIGSVQGLIEAEVKQKDLTFEAVGDASLVVRADPGKMRQILLNLLANAIKFTEPGGTISVGAHRQNRAEGSGQRPGSMIRIWVRDTGVGIPEEQLEHVLEPFVQVERGTTRRYPGVGLGLAIARDLARAMQGELHLERAAGTGTTATLVLPSA